MEPRNFILADHVSVLVADHVQAVFFSYDFKAVFFSNNFKAICFAYNIQAICFSYNLQAKPHAFALPVASVDCIHVYASTDDFVIGH
jgi:hypothetical protein